MPEADFRRIEPVNESDAGGYSVAYRRDEIEFPVYVTGILAVVLCASGLVSGQVIWLALGVAAAGYAYYNLPLLERGRPALGANQYGVFIQAFGLVRWRAIDRIDLGLKPDRAATAQELQIALKVPADSALVADWRRLPLHRRLMRLPWRLDRRNVIHIDVEPLDRPPEEIHRTLLRMWRFYRS